MKEIQVVLPNRPGELARVSVALGQKGVNITSIAGVAASDPATVAFVTDQESDATSALQGLGLEHKVVDMLTIDLEDHAGALGKMADKLAKANINVESVYLLSKSGGKAQVGITTNDNAKAKSTLGL